MGTAGINNYNIIADAIIPNSNKYYCYSNIVYFTRILNNNDHINPSTTRRRRVRFGQCQQYLLSLCKLRSRCCIETTEDVELWGSKSPGSYVLSRYSFIGGDGSCVVGAGGVDGAATLQLLHLRKYVPNTCILKCRRTFAYFNNCSRDVSKPCQLPPNIVLFINYFISLCIIIINNYSILNYN